MKPTDSDVCWQPSPIEGEEIMLWSRQGRAGRLQVTCWPETRTTLTTSQLLGEPSTLNVSASPNDASACSFAQVLTTPSMPETYSLSTTAKAGILRRAEKRKKQLPAAVRAALES